MYKNIILFLLVVFLALQVVKIYNSYKLNKMLNLKKKQLRVNDELVKLKKPTGLTPKLGLVLNAVLIAVVIFLPSDNNQLINLESDNLLTNRQILIDSYTDELMDDSLNKDADVTTANLNPEVLETLDVDSSMRLLGSSMTTKVSDGLIYQVVDNHLIVREVTNQAAISLCDIELNNYVASDIYLTDNYIVILGKIRKPEFYDDDLRAELAYTYDTVIDVYSRNNFKKVNEYLFDGYFDSIELNNDEVIVTTVNKLFRNLIIKDQALASYSSSVNSNTVHYEDMVINKNVDKDVIRNAYVYNINSDTVKVDSVVLDDFSGVKIINDSLYFYTVTTDGKTAIYHYVDDDYQGSFKCEGQVINDDYIYEKDGYLYTIASLNNSIMISKVNAYNMRIVKSFEFTKTNYIYNLEFDATNLIFTYHDVNENLDTTVLYDLLSMSINDEDYVTLDTVKFKISDEVYAFINNSSIGYTLQLKEVKDGNYKELTSYKFNGSSFDGYAFKDAKYYPNARIILVNTVSNRYAFTNMLTAISIDNNYNIASIVNLKSGILNQNSFDDCIVKNNYLYVIGESEIRYYLLSDASVYGTIELN